MINDANETINVIDLNITCRAHNRYNLTFSSSIVNLIECIIALLACSIPYDELDRFIIHIYLLLYACGIHCRWLVLIEGST